MIVATNSSAAPVAKRRDALGQRCDEQAQEEQGRRGQCRQARASARLDACGALDVARGRGGAEYAPMAVALESDSSARRRRGRCPSSLSIPARLATPTRVPAVSNTSTRSSVRITVTIDRSKAARTSSSRNVLIDGGAETRPWKSAAPVSPAEGT
jgi:hypothetical protein